TQLLQLPGRLREVGVDGIELLNGGKVGRLALPNQRAFGHQRATDTAADRRADAGIVEIELGARDLRLARGDISLRLTKRRPPRHPPPPRRGAGRGAPPPGAPLPPPVWLALAPGPAPPPRVGAGARGRFPPPSAPRGVDEKDPPPPLPPAPLGKQPPNHFPRH